LILTSWVEFTLNTHVTFQTGSMFKYNYMTTRCETSTLNHNVMDEDRTVTQMYFSVHTRARLVHQCFEDRLRQNQCKCVSNGK